MLLVKSPDDVDAIRPHCPFLIQCPKSKKVYVIIKKGNGRPYYGAVQRIDGLYKYITDDSKPNIQTDVRYHFTKTKLKELIRNKSFTIAR